MRFSGIAVVVIIIAKAVAHSRGGWDWVHGLPSCWEDCLENSGCDSKSCICKSSQDGDYLTSAVECAVQSCSADGLAIALSFLAPLQMYCKATRDDIPDDIMGSAYACATATAMATTPSPTRKVEPSTQASKIPKDASDGLDSTITSTVTVTTTNEDGSTLQVLIPIIMGPGAMTTGEMVTSTLESKATFNSAATSTGEAAGSTVAAQAPSRPQESPAPSATAQATNIGNGTPFDLSAQGGSARWGFSAIFVGIGMLFGACARI